MKALLCTTALALGLVALPEAKAQVIRAEVIIGDPHYRDRVPAYHRPVRRIVVDRYSPRLIVVDRHHRGRGHYKHNGRNYRSVRVWFDRNRAAYYDAYRPGLREVTVYELDGRYYDDYRDRDDRDRDRYDDRDGRYHD